MGYSKLLLFLTLCLAAQVLFALAGPYGKPKSSRRLKDPKENWGYANIREDAFMFWWLYYFTGNASYLDQPLVMWLQGGPGSSSTGYGNFVEIGPLDYNLTARDTTWVNEANVLFVDNPVGTGYSYVTNVTALTTNNAEIADDMLLLLTAFFTTVPEFQKIPFYIFSESYGGKMGIEIGWRLQKAIENGSIPCTFKGVVMGDSWISGLDSVLTWGPYLYSTSMVDETGYAAINASAQLTKQAVDEGAWLNATLQWSETESVVDEVTYGVNFYNIELRPDQTMITKAKGPDNKALKKLYNRHVAKFQEDQLSDLMNGPIREKLRVIPDNVTWGGQSGAVFDALSVDFMKNVSDIVELMLNNTNLQIVVMNAQLDLIVDTPGTMSWVSRLNWAGLPNFMSAPRLPISLTTDPVVGFYKSYKNLAFYWVLNAGHMIPTDQGWTSLKVLDMIIHPEATRQQSKVATKKRN